MPTLSRRQALWGSVSVLVLTGAAIYAAPSLSQLGPSTKAARPVISFADAKVAFVQKLRNNIELSQTDFSVKYSPEQIQDIENRAWDSAQTILSQYYDPKEMPPELHKELQK